MIEDSQPLSEDEIKEMFVDIPLMPDNVDENAVVSFFLTVLTMILRLTDLQKA